jgi:kynurenine formamidase
MGILATLAAAGAACTSQRDAPPPVAAAAPLTAAGWVDVTATLDPTTTPVYEGDAPMQFEFLKDMRNGDGLTLSKYSLGAHSGTHIDAPMHFVAGGAPIDQVARRA